MPKYKIMGERRQKGKQKCPFRVCTQNPIENRKSQVQGD